MKKQDTPITKIEIAGEITDIGEKAMKELPPGRRYRYAMPVKYHLSDGTTEMGTVRSKTKKGISEKYSDRENDIAKGRAKAWFCDDGKFRGLNILL